ncbi:C1 family peptidase [Flavivirga eckloniae]|uniref:C1 family peptidase n=1 Tax=Flavivirga eckloniae TaxID=1803846 RepID=UPI0013157FD5|nr:C1 family peptidase [Flavivirga eckloniae]
MIGLFGIKSVIDYSKEIAQKRLNEITEEQLNQLLRNETENQVATLLNSKQSIIESQLEVYTRQKISEINISTSPISGSRNTILDTTVVSDIKSNVDHSSDYGIVKDQGSEGSTVAFAVTSAIEFLYLKKQSLKIDLSPRYLYNNINNGQDYGATFVDAFNFSIKTGIIESRFWEYKPGEYKLKPPSESKDKRHFKIKYFRRTSSSIEETKNLLNINKAIVSGLIIYQSNYNNKNGLMTYPKVDEQPMGGHAICLVGYDDNKQLIKFKNSWGKNWGDNGYGYISYADFEKLVKESYLIEI